MLASGFSSAVGNLLFALVVLAGFAIYLTLVRQISVRRTATAVSVESGQSKTFGLPEALLVSILILLMLIGVYRSIGRSPIELGPQDLLADVLLRFIVIGFIVAFLRLRGFDIDALGGFSRASLKRAISTGIILLLAAAPLIMLAEGITQTILGGGSSKQEIVDLFSSSQSIRQRVAIIVLAVVVAPISEEFIFRFFIYGVLRRYFGIAIGLVFNALLFGAAHTHLPSALPLFVLGLCFTLAYEWSGSILVSMAMHALFNSTQLILLAFPDSLQQ